MAKNNPIYQKLYFKEWYNKNKSRHIAVCSIRRKEQVKLNQRRIVAYLKKHSCVDCGEKDIVVLQFDHVRGKKFKEIGKMISRSWKTILKEIAKCDVRCANDHVRRTSKVQKSYRLVA